MQFLHVFRTLNLTVIYQYVKLSVAADFDNMRPNGKFIQFFLLKCKCCSAK